MSLGNSSTLHCLSVAAKEKLRKLKIHKTGGGPRPVGLMTIEEAIARIFGNTPGFAGIVTKEKGDSKIQIKRGPNNNDLQGRVCAAEMVVETSNLHKALNTGNNYKYFILSNHYDINCMSHSCNVFSILDAQIDVEHMAAALVKMREKENSKKEVAGTCWFSCAN